MEKEILNKLLFKAAEENDLKQAKLLIEIGADLNVKNEWSDTLLRNLFRMILNNITTPKL